MMKQAQIPDQKLRRETTFPPSALGELGRGRISLPAFTLTELLVAIALLAIIMVAVTTIFRTAGQTVAMGIAITDANRAIAAAGQQFHQDIIGYSDTDPYVDGSGLWTANETDPSYAPPFLFLRNFTQNSYRDQNALTANTTEAFRLDSIGFFTRGAFKRQTGSNQLIDLMPVFTRAYVWYGHLRLTDGNGLNPRPPGYVNTNWQVDNPTNYFASQWILGRRAVLLGDVIPTGSQQGHIVDYLGQQVHFYGRDWDPAGTQAGENYQWDPTRLTPLSSAAQATLYDQSGYIATEKFTESRYDLVGLNREQTWGDYRDLVQTYQTRFQAGNPLYSPSWVERYFTTRHVGSPTEAIDIDWAQSTIANNKANFQTLAALAVPILLRNCTSFTVEFAGDYVDQDAAGNVKSGSNANFDVTDPATWHLDGVIDYDVVNGRQQIRWYGLGNTVQSKRGCTNPMPFELLSNATTYTCGWTRDMLCLPLTTPVTPQPSLAPRLLRLTVNVTDPQGRIVEDMTRQFVLPVKCN